MISSFYSRFSLPLLLLALASLVPLSYLSETIPNNNDIETWLPSTSQMLDDYDQFKEKFGSEEIVLLGVYRNDHSEQFVNALAGRLERLSTVANCWSPKRFRELMEELEVEEEEIDKRLSGLVESKDSDLTGLVIVLSKKGEEDRALLVHEIEAELSYCQLEKDDYLLAGGSVVVAELDRLGGQESAKPLFILTLLVSTVLLFYFLRQWKPTFAILGITVWAINATMGAIHLAGGEMNFILSVVPVMVMVFTLAVAIHFLHYYAAEKGEQRIQNAIINAWKPCFFATLTTDIGLVSLGISEFAPVRLFGYGAACGCTLAMIAGLFLTPAVITLFPLKKLEQLEAKESKWNWQGWIIQNRIKAITAAMLLVVGLGIGIVKTEVYIEPIDFLPTNSKVLADDLMINEKLTGTDSIEAIYNFENVYNIKRGDETVTITNAKPGSSFIGEKLSFVEKLNIISKLHEKFDRNLKVQHTTSISSFFPKEFPDSFIQTSQILDRAQSNSSGDDDEESSSGGKYIADSHEKEDQNLWRISMRITIKDTQEQQEIIDQLKKTAEGEPVTFTGIAPLLKQAQYEIFDGFWKSFAMAFVIITCVMALALQSIRAAIIAMIPNLTPILIVFGVLGWVGKKIDIGMMMTGSVALGIAVDGTFHYLALYNKYYRSGKNREESAEIALRHAGAPIAQAALICGVGMLAMTISNFRPTVNFGFLMANLLAAALIGDLVLLPALMALGGKKRSKAALNAAQSEDQKSDTNVDSNEEDEDEGPSIFSINAAENPDNPTDEDQQNSAVL